MVLGHFPQKYPVVNYTDISLVGFNTVDSKERVDLKSISGIVVLKTTVKEVAEFWEDFDKILSFHTVQELLKSEENV